LLIDALIKELNVNYTSNRIKQIKITVHRALLSLRQKIILWMLAFYLYLVDIRTLNNWFISLYFFFLKKIVIYFSSFFLNCCALWGNIVTFTKLLTMYKVYQPWIHPLHHSPSFSLIFHSHILEIVSTGLIFTFT
jgi:hypothetical protein